MDNSSEHLTVVSTDEKNEVQEQDAAKRAELFEQCTDTIEH